jgi:HSP20 family protein
MSRRQFEAMMWADACAKWERAQRLQRQFFHHAASSWEAPIDVFETEDSLIVEIALPGVDPDQITVSLSAGLLVVSGERPLPRESHDARIVRLEIPHGHFERRIELPPVPLQISGRHLANGCLMLRLKKG